MHPPEQSGPEQQPPFHFETTDQATLDLMLLVNVVDDFGGNLQAASNIVCNATTISGAEQDTKSWIDRMMTWRQTGTLRPDLLAMSDADFAEYVREDAASIVERHTTWAVEKLTEKFMMLTDESQIGRLTHLLEILGVEYGPDGFRATDRDEERVAAIIKTAKLMDIGYKEFVGANPEYMAGRDPEIAAELEGTVVLDSRIMQILRELRHEI